ncbi:MAG: UvrD-helicase domain-containing protein [Eubacteriales bacterium]|nr:UvrD-helicase domain-containing protein [Eubacteriales bacterium]
MSIYDTLNDRQREAVFKTRGPVLILAGAGSGKTRVLTHRIAYLIGHEEVRPWNILAITFTNKAAGEMRERVDDLIGHGADQIWVSTFHSTCVRILRRYIDRLGYDTNFTIYDADDSKNIIKDVCKKLQVDTKLYKERSLMSAISSAKDELVSPTEYERRVMGDFGKRKIAGVYQEYQKALKKNNALDFDDLIVKTVELFKACPDVLDYYQERFRYIMVDEYQDTNTAQFELVRLLADKYRNLCVVGDDDQSIYKFRGANISNILDFEKVFPEAAVIKLEQNYRSTQTILDAANEVIRNNTERKEKALWTEKGEGSRIHFRQFDTAYEEAEYIADEISHKKKRQEAEFKDCAVLYRTNAQARLLEEKFILEGIPYDVVGGVNFYARKEIKDMLAYLKTIDNGQDDLQVRRIINVPRRGIGAATINKVQLYADENGISFYDALRQADQIPGLGRSVSKLDPFVTMIQSFRSKLEYYSLEQLMNDIIESTGYVKELQDSDEEDAEDRINNINELVSKIVAFEASHEDASLSGFLEEVALVADIDGVDSDNNKVLLMTLHSAKGLEFPIVYLAGMEDGIFPSYMSITADDPGAVEEERRLAYVGITRAKDDLTITYARSRMLRGETQYNPVSRFVREIPGNLMDNRVPGVKKFSFGEESGDGGGYSGFSGFSGFDGGTKSGSKGEGGFGGGFSGFGGYNSTTGVSGNGAGGASSSGWNGGFGSAAGAYAGYGRPKAVVRPKRTAAENKPFIAKGIDSLSGVNGLKKGSSKESALEYGVGDRVRHIKFGDGTVTAIVDDPRDYKVTIQFDGVGQKIMYAAFAKLKKK